MTDQLEPEQCDQIMSGEYLEVNVAPPNTVQCSDSNFRMCFMHLKMRFEKKKQNRGNQRRGKIQ